VIPAIAKRAQVATAEISQASTRRAPHLYLRDGRSLYDAFGPGYSLLRFDPSVDVARLRDAAAQRKVPLALIDLAPADADALIARITGAAAARVTRRTLRCRRGGFVIAGLTAARPMRR
jgi:hypothetical protein